MSTQHHSLITVVVNNVPWGVFETRAGGATTAEVSKYRSQPFGKQKARKGQPETDDVTVGRSWDRDRDYDLSRQRQLVGVADVIVTDQPLDDAGAPFKKPTIYTGTLTSMTDGDSDINSNDPKSFELVIVVTEVS